MDREREPKPEHITIPSNRGKTFIDPSDLPTEELQRLIACAIFLPHKRIRIIAEYQYPGLTDEITPKQLKDAALHWSSEDVFYFIEEKANNFSLADRIIIERLEE